MFLGCWLVYGIQEHTLLFLHHGQKLGFHLLSLLYFFQQILLRFLQLNNPLHFLLFLLQPRKHVIIPHFLEFLESFTPKFINILFRFDLNESNFIPFFYFSSNNLLTLFLNIFLIFFLLLFDMRKQLMISLSKLIRFGSYVISPAHSLMGKYSTI